MKTKILILLSFTIIPFVSVLPQSTKSEVLIISSIHGAHKVNPNYPYDSIFSFIEKQNPDVLGVEIRQEDMDSSVAYLKSFYPYEMYESIQKYNSKKTMGFDWLGEELEGRAVPENYWKDKSVLKNLQRKLAVDTLMHPKLAITDVIQEEMKKVALNASLTELNDGRYDLLSSIYYKQLELLLKDTEYQVLTDFYKKRDEMISQNIIEIIKNNKGKKMIFLLGADHRDYTVKKVTEKFGDAIRLNHFSK